MATPEAPFDTHAPATAHPLAADARPEASAAYPEPAAHEPPGDFSLTAPEIPAVEQAASIDLEALADQVTERVLARMSDAVVRDTVATIVTSVAERLVLEEIERIRASIVAER